ncbi:hypothetical protein IAR55_005214 [Kwoniella newhampshirensis]|uniref:WAC domain-containing protein n=1 Tax=Kwoniella newhampshirensis TaxID=1651941 RepID=A0AAW0YV47_9TREE
MPLLKRRPVLLTPLPSLSTVLQPIATHQPTTATAESSTPSSPSKSKATPPTVDDLSTHIPPDGKDDEEQLEKLLSVFRGEFGGGVVAGPGGARGGRKSIAGKPTGPVTATMTSAVTVNGENGMETQNGNGDAKGENGGPAVAWRIHDRECWYLPETGEIFTDYESFCLRRAFYSQPLFQCEVSGKSSLSFFSAVSSEQKEVRQLHSRFPRQLKKAVLSAVQFQIEGKLDTLADKIYERFHNRFFDDEKVFVDVDGDKYLARIVKTFPPRSLTANSSSPFRPTAPIYHPFAADLSRPIEEVNEKDDPMRYFYNVRLIEEGAAEGIAAEYASATGMSNGHDDEEDDGKGEKWQASTMEVQADKISRDRINFSRAMLKRFIRDCVVRDTAVYSPWLVKPSVAQRYGIPSEMTDEIREGIARYKERQMDKRKREREERLGLNNPPEPEVEEEKPKTKKQKKEEERKQREDEKLREKEEREREKEREKEEEEKKKKKTLKYPAEDLLVEWQEERDRAAGKLEVRPTPIKSLPFGDQFEQFLMAWSFLNVMG